MPPPVSVGPPGGGEGAHFGGQRVVRVNCRAIPEDLVESTLFGHERGAFTGALQQQKGVFEEADGGAVFLDEIGELPQEGAGRGIVQQYEAKILHDTLEAAGWNRAEAARQLGLPVRTLSYRMKVLGVRKPYTL
jgi:transcriptional regulator with GAF, ATPase, and Fis domain